MKKCIVSSLIAILCSSLTSAQSLEEVLEAHFEVMGVEAAKKVNTIKYQGVASQMGMEFPMYIYTKRIPNGMMVRTELEFQGQVIIPSAWNGSEGWKRMPGMSGEMTMENLSPRELESLKDGRIEGELYALYTSGKSLILDESEEFEGTLSYVVKTISEDGQRTLYYIDQESFVLLGTETIGESEQGSYNVVETRSNYTVVDGMAIALSRELKVNGQTTLTMEYEEVKVNVEIEDSVFNRP